jgi:cell division protein FtsN
VISIDDILLFFAGLAAWLVVGIYVVYRISVAKKAPLNDGSLMVTAILLWPAFVIMYWVETAMHGQ